MVASPAHDPVTPSLKRLPPKKLGLVLIGDYITVYGLRKLAASARRILPDVKIFFVPTGGRLHSIKNILFSERNPEANLLPADIATIADALADCDVVACSSITIDALWTEKIIQATREVNPDAYYVWGGMHCIVAPERAMPHADAICVGEGDLAFDELLTRMKDGQDFYDVENFWFRKPDGEVVKNGFRALLTPDEMGTRPHVQYAEDGEEFIYERDKGGFIPTDRNHYLDFNGLAYHTIWTQGCPYRCTYCGNTAFLAIDKKYASIRQPSVDYIIEEVLLAKAKHPHLSTVVFDDDCMGALPIPVLKEFAEKWREKVKIPFFVAGIIPAFIQREKTEILLWAGMNRMRMGLQSGSDRMLKFFKRPNKPGVIQSATNIIGDYTDFMIPPAYDIIVDGPMEMKEDVIDSLNLVNNMPRPFTINLCSLRIIPGTVLAQQVEELKKTDPKISMDEIDTNYHDTNKTFYNALMFVSATFRIPKPIFERLHKYVIPCRDKPKPRPLLHFTCRAFFFAKRGLNDLRFMDFSVLPGRVGYWMWRLGIIAAWQKFFVKKFDPAKHSLLGKGNDLSMPQPVTYSSSVSNAAPATMKSDRA
tara:strand:- start:89 stop:1861 length:1773 start_codon:yes stop_codon:yes gene_type:complete